MWFHCGLIGLMNTNNSNSPYIRGTEYNPYRSYIGGWGEYHASQSEEILRSSKH